MKNYCWKKAKVKLPTVLPRFILRLQGTIDGKKGSEVVDSILLKLYKKESAAEAAECVVCETYLSEPRKKAASLLKSVEQIDKIPTPSTTLETSDATVIRSVRKRQAVITTATKGLCDIHAEITTVETILNERIKQLRDNSASKFEAYISGVKVSMPEYCFTMAFNNEALEIYHKRHEALDLAVERFVEREVVSNENI